MSEAEVRRDGLAGVRPGREALFASDAVGRAAPRRAPRGRRPPSPTTAGR
ncbi:hypothetical protein [Streptomyces sp. 8K308]|nr:hypothetical protein [Streptomyces sp. 8K308]